MEVFHRENIGMRTDTIGVTEHEKYGVPELIFYQTPPRIHALLL